MLGFLNIHKTAGLTSHDVVARVRRILRERQVGHAGTLDPGATGVLPVAVGAACRLLRFLPKDKIYSAQILLGQQTTTDDVEGEILQRRPVEVSLQALRDALRGFEGMIEQVPPLVSAVHVGGERLYKLAREGRAPDSLPARQVHVYSLELLGFDSPLLSLRIHCAGGTYIRSIARDLGEKLGCGACLSQLVREQAGPFLLQDAVPLEQFQVEPPGWLTAPERILPLPVLDVDEEEARRIRNGQRLRTAAPLHAPDDFGTDLPDHVMVVSAGRLVAVCRVSQAILQPEVVIPG